MVDSGKHTPGPWHLSGNLGYVRKLTGHTDDGPKDFNIASIHEMEDGQQADANARLITAAPDMLEALEAIVDSAHDGREYPGWLHERLEQLAIPAIRKAVGDGR